MILLFHFIICILFSAKSPDCEQKAVNHFFDKILLVKYPDLKAVELDTKTDTSRATIAIIMQCDALTKEIKEKTYSQPTEEQVELVVPKSQIKIKKRREWSNRLKISVSSKKKVDDYYFVEITAYRKLRFVDHYVYQFDQLGNLVSVCTKNEVI